MYITLTGYLEFSNERTNCQKKVQENCTLLAFNKTHKSSKNELSITQKPRGIKKKT
jgi:hypothetical protein